jgi:hypothetical protein
LDVRRLIGIWHDTDAVRIAQKFSPLRGIKLDDVFQGKHLPSAGLFQNGAVVRMAALRVEKKHTHSGLAQHKGQLVRAVGGIHVYEDNASQRAPELKNRPLGAVGGPHSGAVAGMQSERPQAGRDALRLVRVFRPGESDVLVDTDEGGAIGKPIRSFEKSFPYRFSDDSSLWTSGITLHRPSLIYTGAFHGGGSIRLALAAQLLYVQNLHLTGESYASNCRCRPCFSERVIRTALRGTDVPGTDEYRAGTRDDYFLGACS